MARLAAITYDGLPISSGGAHKLQTRGFRAGLMALQSFVAATSLDEIPSSLYVELLEGAGVAEDFSAPLRSEFDPRFAKMRSRRVGGYVAHQWRIDPSSLTWVIEKCERASPVPQAAYAGPALVMLVNWNLLFFDSRTRGQLPYQTKEDYLGFDTGSQHFLGHSLLFARISHTTSAHLFLSLPFEDVTPAARQLASEIQAKFPARLSTKRWKIWRLAKSGNGYVGRKIVPPC